MTSSDLELARALSRLLSEPPSGVRPAGPGPRFDPVEPAGPSRFLRFRGTAPRVPETPSAGTATADPASPPFPEE